MGFQIDNERNETTIYFKDLLKFEPFRFPSSSKEILSYKIKIPLIDDTTCKKYNAIDLMNRKFLYIDGETKVAPVNLSIKEV